MSLPTKFMRAVQEGDVVRDEHGVWRQVAVKRVAGREEGLLAGYTTLIYPGGVEEEGPPDAPVTVLPTKLTFSQWDALRCVGRDVVIRINDVVRVFSREISLSKVPVAKLFDFELIETVVITETSVAYRLTPAGEAWLEFNDPTVER
jgi:hypothetical protein